MSDAASLRAQSLAMMDRALLAAGAERLLLLEEALHLHRQARELQATEYPQIDDDLGPASDPETSDDGEPLSPSPASP
jgi:hypothetical protein